MIRLFIYTLTVTLFFATLSTPAFSATAPIPQQALDFKENGNRLFKQGKDMDAASAYTKALHLAPHFFEAYYNRGIVWHRMGLHYKAIVDFDRALEIRKNDPDALYFRGLAHEASAQLDRGLKDLEKAAKKGHHQAKRYLADSDIKARLAALNAKKEKPEEEPTQIPGGRSLRLVTENNPFGGKTTLTLFSKGDPLYEGEEGIFKQVNHYNAHDTLMLSETFHHALFNAKNGRNRTITHFKATGATTFVEYHLTGHNLGKVELYHYGANGSVSKKETLSLSQYQKKIKKLQETM